MAMTALLIQPIPVCVALLKGRLRHGCCTECCTAGCSVCHFAHACPTMPSISLVYIYIRVVRSALNVVRAYFSPIFQYFSANNVTRVSFSQIFQYFVTYVCHAPWFSSALDSSALNSSAMDSSAMDSSTIGVGVTVRVGKIMYARTMQGGA